MSAGLAVRPEAAARRAWRASAVLLCVYAALVATHEGEFWPFSIYPMFSEGGKPWVRTVVYEVEPRAVAGMSWQPQPRESLPGVPFAAREHGIEVIDLAKYISMTQGWDAARVEGLRRMLGEAARGRTLVFHRVAGRLVPTPEGPTVQVEYRPFVAIDDGAAYHEGAI